MEASAALSPRRWPWRDPQWRLARGRGRRGTEGHRTTRHAGPRLPARRSRPCRCSRLPGRHHGEGRIRRPPASPWTLRHVGPRARADLALRDRRSSSAMDSGLVAVAAGRVRHAPPGRDMGGSPAPGNADAHLITWARRTRVTVGGRRGAVSSTMPAPRHRPGGAPRTPGGSHYRRHGPFLAVLPMLMISAIFMRSPGRAMRLTAPPQFDNAARVRASSTRPRRHGTDFAGGCRDAPCAGTLSAGRRPRRGAWPSQPPPAGAVRRRCCGVVAAMAERREGGCLQPPVPDQRAATWRRGVDERNCRPRSRPRL